MRINYETPTTTIVEMEIEDVVLQSSFDPSAEIDMPLGGDAWM